MRKLFIKARDYLDDGLRGMCGRLTPGKRVAAIVGMVVVFAGVNFYMLFRRSITSAGKTQGGKR